MKFHEITCIGKFWMHRIPTLTTWTVDDVGRLIYVEDVQSVYYGGPATYGDWINVSEHYIDEGTAEDPGEVGGETFTDRDYMMKIVNGNIRLYY